MPVPDAPSSPDSNLIKLLLLTDADVFAGTEKLIFDLAGSLNQNAARAIIGCPIPSPLASLATDASIDLLQVGKAGRPKGMAADLLTISRLRNVFREREVDLVHVHNGRSAFIAALAGAGKTVPMVMSQHFLRPARTGRHGAKAVISRFIHQWLEQRIARHIAISEAVKAECILGHVAPASKIDVVLNGVKMPHGSTTQSSWRHEPWASALTRENFVFCAARAEPEKDLPTLVQAMRELRSSNCSAVCAIAGGGRELENVRSLIALASPQPNVTLLGFRHDVADLMSQCALFVLPAVAEPFGLVLAEAMALGKPVIACDAGGPREIVDHGVTGLLVPPGDAKAMAGAINRLLTDSELRGQMGLAGKQRYEKLFTAKAMADSMLEVYQSVLFATNDQRNHREPSY